jgi:hypothetical protein
MTFRSDIRKHNKLCDKCVININVRKIGRAKDLSAPLCILRHLRNQIIDKLMIFNA